MTAVRKILYRLYRLGSSARFRAQRRLTRPGLAVLGGVFAAGLVGLDITQSLAYQVFLVLLSLLLAAWASCWFYRARFTAERLLPCFGTVGSPLHYRVTLRNATRVPQNGLVVLENLADPRPSFDEFIAIHRAEERRMRSFSVAKRKKRLGFELVRVSEAPVPPLLPGQEAEVRLQLTPLRRGHVRFTGLTVARPDPLGLVKAFAKFPLPQSVLVLPRRYPLPPIALPGTMKYQQGGVAMASSVGESEEFVSLRDYRQGDPLRHIHWRSWARVGKPVVKEFQDEFFVRHALILDTFTDHPNSEVFEEAVSVAASFACTILTQESLLDLLFVGPEAYCFTSGRGLAHTEQILEILASVRVCRGQGFQALENLVIDHVSLVSGCVVVLLDWDARRRSFIERLKMLGLPVLVLVVTEAGAKESFEAGPMQDQPQQFHVLEAGAIEEGLARL
ncbi:MAG: DUF58 domain-containing protein [Verrucomicrobia bacterium]|nr:DUF58 domain-containing protein [Verrucomicrobiota bacterium]